jgi:hypothetical protein
MDFKPERIGTQIELTGPFQAASTITNTNLRKKYRIAECPKDTFAGKMLQIVPRRLAVSPSEGYVMGERIGHGSHNDILQHLRHL